MESNRIKIGGGGFAREAALFVLACVFAPSLASAQEPRAKARLLDRTVATVGDEVILLSEIDEEVLLAQTRDGSDLSEPDSLAAARQVALAGLIEARTLLAKAHDEGIRATREEVEESVEKMIADLKARFPNEEAFELQLERESMTIEKLRATYRERMKDQLEIGKLVDQNVKSKVEVSETEIRAYYDAHQAEIPPLPASLGVRRIRTNLRSASAVDSAAANRARIVRDRLILGEDFATLASVFSEGPDAAKGGDLGWFRAGDLDPMLEQSVESLRPGEVSDVVTSASGTHIFKLEERDGDRFRLRQIVFLRDESGAKAAALSRIESAKARLDRGEDFVKVAGEVSEDGPDAESRGRVINVPVESLDARFRSALEKLEVGQISEVIEDQDGFSIFRIEERVGERPSTFDDVRDRLSNLLRQEKTEKKYDEYLAKVRQEIYVEVLPEPGS